MKSMNSEELSVFSAFLKKKIEERNWSVKEFADKAGLSEKYSYRLVSPKRDFVPGDDTVEKIIEALGVRPEEGKYFRDLIILERKAGKPVFPGHGGLPVPPGSGSDEPSVSQELTVLLSAGSYKKLREYADKEGKSVEEVARGVIDGFLLSLPGGSLPGAAPDGYSKLEERMDGLEEKMRALKALVMGMGVKLQETSDRLQLVMGAIGLHLPDYSK